ncbi:MAG: hypothetical protein KA072_09470 [Thermoanaerobaculaceae bacterium]|nr:hypothetical protein [Thermoanaerobaculaceae bacterium]MDI9621024.1 hypothetical protein [Acidobacteriota bacterium]NLH12663.1 hypothetical protein [Holophagae bacterium]HPW55861.1 hypothetical protein [Thermoanaerobaculaceae bacterium]
MNRNLFKLLVVLVVVSFVGLAVANAEPPKATNPPAHHGKAMKGSISALDDAAKTFKLKDPVGKETDFTWTTATQVQGALKVGETATVAYMVKDGKNVATSIHVAVPAAAAPAKKK